MSLLLRSADRFARILGTAIAGMLKIQTADQQLFFFEDATEMVVPSSFCFPTDTSAALLVNTGETLNVFLVWIRVAHSSQALVHRRGPTERSYWKFIQPAAGQIGVNP
jgi:hypothetical protein